MSYELRRLDGEQMDCLTINYPLLHVMKNPIYFAFRI